MTTHRLPTNPFCTFCAFLRPLHSSSAKSLIIFTLLTIIASLAACKTTDPARTLYLTRTDEIRNVIVQQHGSDLTRLHMEIIEAEPDWFQALPLGTAPASETGLQWVWLLGGEREIHASFAGRINEPVDPRRVTIKLMTVPIPAFKK